jgi:NADH dehydrogenase
VAWFLWRGVYLFKLPTWSRRIKVAFDWAWDVVFPRDLGFLNTDESQLITHAFYRPGDFIHRQGEPARVFSVIEEGEVEILQTTDGNQAAKVLAMLGKGDFFGEGALLGNRPHETSVRARTVVRLRQVGSALFSQIAGTFAPFRELLAKAVTRRSGDFWSRLPLAKSFLEGEALEPFLDAPPAQFLNKETTLEEAIIALNESAAGQLLILDENQCLWATLDRSDLYQIIARISVAPADTSGDFRRHKLKEILFGDPVYVTPQDSILAAAATMLDHGISWMPVVQSKNDLRPIGVLRGERISARMIQKIGHTETDQAKAAN